MSDRTPPSSRRADGVLPPVGARTPGLDELGDDDEWDDEEWYEPNYLMRRALAIGAGIVALAVVAFLIMRVIDTGDDNGSGGDAVDADWNTIAVLTADEIILVDPSSGEVLDTYDAEADLLDAQSIVIGNVLVTMTDTGRIVQTDLTDGSVTRGRSGVDESLRRSGDNPTIAISGADGGGDITLVDTNTRTTSSVGSVSGLDDPLIFAADVLISPSGTHAAMSDARSFQSIVVDVEAESAALLAGQVVALSDDEVVTAQRAGANTELEFYDLVGQRLGSVDVPTPVASMLTSNGSMLLVDSTGAIRLANADGEVSEVGLLADPTDPTASIEVESGVSARGGTRLLVTTTRQVFVLDDSGVQIGTALGDVTSTVSRSTHCVTIGSPRSTGTSVQLDLDDASVRAEISGGTVSTTSLDGCTAALIGATSPQILHDGDVLDVDADSIVDIAPDGDSYVVLDGRDTELVSIGDDNTIEIADVTSVIRFAQR